MEKIKHVFAFAWELLVEGYEIVLGLIEGSPRIAFWLIVGLAIMAAL